MLDFLKRRTDFRDVQKFHKKFGVPTNEVFTFPSLEMFDFRKKFLREELEETSEAFNACNIPEFADGLIDFVYVALGTADISGIPEEYFPVMFNAGTGVYLDSRTVKGYLALIRSEVDYWINSFYNRNEEAYVDHLVRMTELTYVLASVCGLPWDKLWKEVQRANMSKVRAKSADDSKRASSFDVVKPQGWKAPDIEGVIKKYYR